MHRDTIDFQLLSEVSVSMEDAVLEAAISGGTGATEPTRGAEEPGAIEDDSE